MKNENKTNQHSSSNTSTLKPSNANNSNNLTNNHNSEMNCLQNCVQWLAIIKVKQNNANLIQDVIFF